MAESADIATLAEGAASDDAALASLIEELSGPSRRGRQQAAAAVASVARATPERVAVHIEALADALNRPEAQTRWEVLDALTELVSLDSRSCDKAIPDVEASLFDEESGPAHLAAVRFLCRLGATTENRSEKTWPLIDEAIQCYHGDNEFPDMLVAVIAYSEGKLSAQVKEQLAARMAFDAANSRGSLKKRAQQIIDNVK